MLRSKTQYLPYAMIAIGSFIAAFGLCALLQRSVLATDENSKISKQVVTSGPSNLDESEPDCDSYEVAANMPRRIILPTIAADGCLQKVGIDENGAIAVPNNIHLGGWYEGLKKPGQEGLSLIDGHLRGLYQQGIFENLYKLKHGDEFRIEYGDRSIRTFEVVSVDSYSIRETTQKMFDKKQDIASQLNLITCFGTWQTDTQQFDKRLVVVSKLVE